MSVSGDLHQKRNVEFIEVRKCDTKPHIYIFLSQFTTV